MRQDQPSVETMIRPFALLWHELPVSSELASHWDLMIQSGDNLATWRLPLDWTKTPRQTVERIADHRLAYLDLFKVPSPPPRGRGQGEGAQQTTNHPIDLEFPLSNNRGSVRQIASGEFLVHRWTDNEIVGEIRHQGGVASLQLTREENSTNWILDLRIV